MEQLHPPRGHHEVLRSFAMPIVNCMRTAMLSPPYNCRIRSAWKCCVPMALLAREAFPSKLANLLPASSAAHSLCILPFSVIISMVCPCVLEVPQPPLLCVRPL